MTLCRYAECRCAECCDLFIVSLNVIMPSVVAPLNVKLSINYSQGNIKLYHIFYCYAGVFMLRVSFFLLLC
jgi:hypothetical protein